VESLFIVGDTKQAIYASGKQITRLCSKLEKSKEKFNSVEVSVKPLVTNRREPQAILDFVSSIFPKGIKNHGGAGQDNKKNG
jgi:ATP-dependent exoDNAse (exonuclease V) beta subunit